MAGYIRASRLLISTLLVFLIWTDLALGRAEIGQEAVVVVEAPSRGTNVTSRGGPRDVSASAHGRGEMLLVRAQFPPPTPTPSPSPTPSPTPTPMPSLAPRLDYLGVFRVTAYSDSALLNGTDGRGVTRSGERTRWGVVAVDPRVIPLHSRMKIDGFGDTVFTALDTGGGIIGRWVDVWYPTDREAILHGLKYLGVHLVAE